MADTPDWAKDTAPIAADVPDWAKEPETPRSAAGSFLHGIAHGATAGWSDELRGLAAASGYAEAMPYLKDAPGSLEDAGKQVRDIYTSQRDAERKAIEESQKQHPSMTGAGELTGAVAGMAMLPGTGPAVAGAKLVPPRDEAIKRCA